jgi:1,4-dihydroxy-2-naphthoyl-CoA hydrolase
MDDVPSASSSAIWHDPLSLDALNTMGEGNMGAHLDIRFTEVGPDFLRASMPVDERTRQPFGLLHGGASVVLAETVGSVAANACVDLDACYCVGVEVNANHLRPVREGRVTATARPLHRGRSTQVWQIHIRNEADTLICASRLTVAVVMRAEK